MTKGPVLQNIWDKLPEDRKNRIHERADELEAQYLALHELRKAAGLTQAAVSEILNMPQSNVSRLENNSDMLLSTIRAYVEAIGGTLNLSVEFPDKPPVMLTGLGDLIENGDTDSAVKHPGSTAPRKIKRPRATAKQAKKTRQRRTAKRQAITSGAL
jgi:transcriptional regulator with XRE-family HTH domain